MENFSHLLNQYIQRAGISDAELSRAISVSRQTIFRWREGMTARPRYREDVLAIARKLRLSAAERDQLLLAAGFRPEEPTPAKESDSGEPPRQLEESAEPHPAASPPSHRWFWLLPVVIAILLAVGLGIWWVYAATNRAPAIAPASSGETLVLVTHFANYAGGQVGYNIAGRLTGALQQEIDQAQLEKFRVAEWPQVVGTRAEAVQVGRTLSATLVIYGEYDAGRIMVQFTHPTDQSAFVDPALQQYVAGVPELSAIINSDLPQLVRPLALMALGQIYLNQQETGQARSLLVRARNGLQNATGVDEKTWALANFYLGLAHQETNPPDLDAAIAAYNQAVDAWPSLLSSRVNRSVALTMRAMPNDLEQALMDMDYVIAAKPDWPLAYSNRASILINRGGQENFARAAADLKTALALDPNLPGAYLHRAYLAYKQDRPLAAFLPDLKKTLDLRPDDVSALNLLCWAYGVEQQPEEALPYCEQLIAFDSSPLFRDSRALTYALLGETEAAMADFEASAAWMARQENNVWQEPLARRRAWLKALRAGRDPFAPEVLVEIRHEFGK